MGFLRALLSDLVKLKLPVTAAAFVATVLALVEPFGVTLGGDTTAKLGAALVAIGVIAAYVQDRLGGVEVQTNPATLTGPEPYPLIPAGSTPEQFALPTQPQAPADPHVTRGDE